MSLNRSLLTQISEDLQKKKKPSKPRVPRNQWQHPGEVTTIPSNNITMDGVSYPVMGVPNVGPPQMMYPDQQYSYPGASNVTEYPKMRMGGLLSRSVKCRNCGHSWKSTDGGSDPLTCHKCGHLNLMKEGGWLESYENDSESMYALGGEMIRRADGSYSKRGLWDNIRANRGSKKKPTPEMNAQKRRITGQMQEGGQRDEAMRASIMKGVDKTLAYGLKGAKWIGKNVFGTDDIVPDVVKDYMFNTVRPVSYPTDMRQVVAEFTRSDKAKPTKDLQGDLSMDEEAWSKVLRRPTKNKYFVPSKYKPSNATDPNAQYYTLSSDVFDGERMKRVLDDSYFNRNKKVNKQGQEYVPMQTIEPFIKKEFMDQYKKYSQMPFDQTDPLANFQVYRGVDPKTKKKYLSISDTYDFGMDSANEVIKPMNIYDRFYYAKGGQSRDEREMVNGIADILKQVKDEQNREQIARQMMADFERDDVTYDPQDFREMAELKYGGHGGLDRWFAEKWVDVKTGKACGRQEGESRKGYPACRPSKRVNSDTPKTASELSGSEKVKFKREKTSSKRIDYNHKKEEGGQTGWLEKYN